MARLPMRAKHQRADGTPTVRIDDTTYWTVDEAARGLALVYAEYSVVHGGVLAVRTGLQRAADQQVLRQPGREVGGAWVRAYRQALEQHRARFVRYVQRGGSFVPVTRAGLDPSEATHIRVEVPTFLDIEEAARGLALHFEEFPHGVRVGRMTCERGLQAAVSRRLQASESTPDPEVVQRFRNLLVDQGIF